ncbi:MAG: anti-sigma factor [Porphyrobacter sp.]|nr:anti-sigma factor [Porphyrobacter sp.]
MSVTEEMLAAYADGELDGEDKAAVEAAIADDPALARSVEAHRALKARLAAHYAPLTGEAVPDRLAALLQPDAMPAKLGGGGEVVSFAAERQRRGLAPVLRRWAPIAGPAIAASLVLAILQPWQGGAPEGYARGNLAAALDTQLAASQPADAKTRILLSFERKGGGLCRAWRGADTGGIACHDQTGWKIERQFALSEAGRTEFRQAGSDADLLAAAQDMAAGGALDAESERAARDRDWLP